MHVASAVEADDAATNTTMRVLLLLLKCQLQKLAFTLCEVKLVPQESIAAVERSITDLNKAHMDKVWVKRRGQGSDEESEATCA